MAEEKNLLEGIENQGHFGSLLKRTFSQVKTARAENINEDAELAYRQNIENQRAELRKKERNLENSLDYSPSGAGEMINEKNFNATNFVQIDKELALDLRDAKIELEESIKRYIYLFGREI